MRNLGRLPDPGNHHQLRRIGQHEDGDLVFVGQVEGLLRQVQRFVPRPRSEDDARELPVPGVENQLQIALLSPRGQARRRPRLGDAGTERLAIRAGWQ